MLHGVDGRAQVGVLAADPWGALRRSPDVLEILDGPRGRYLVTRSADGWTTVAPTDARRLRHRVAELLAARRRWSVQVIVAHQLAGGLGDRAGQRRVDRERVGEVLDVQLVLHGQRDRQDQLARFRSDDHTADTTPVAGRQNSLTKPRRRPSIFARGLVERAA